MSWRGIAGKSATAALLLNVALPLIAFRNLPDRIPTHFDWSGHVQGWGSKYELFGLPLFAGLLYAALSLLRRLPTSRMNVPVRITAINERVQRRLLDQFTSALRLWLMLTMLYIEWAMVESASGRFAFSAAFLPLTFLAVFGTIGWYQYAARKAG
ncbi:MAG: hypothetical protein NVS1B14_03810 [Vulcanimicrobiaceae bacterium]